MGSTLNCGFRIAQACKVKGLAERYWHVAAIAATAVALGLAFDEVQAITSNDHNVISVPRAGLVMWSTPPWLAAKKRGLKKAEGRRFYKPGAPGLWNPIERIVPEGRSDWKVVYAFDFLDSGREYKLRASHEIRSGKTSLDVGANFGFPMAVCGIDFIRWNWHRDSATAPRRCSRWAWRQRC